ncbi:MAG: hypothetical protein OEX19_10970, partial [Gammaproteobacteria bacterium]|nr:hypothetical protein [Gammaproteobacteria bacterium]
MVHGRTPKRQRVSAPTATRNSFQQTSLKYIQFISRLLLISLVCAFYSPLFAQEYTEKNNDFINLHNLHKENSEKTCQLCHDGQEALAKPSTHIPSSENCDSCHNSAAWTPARFDHKDTSLACENCHNGSFATASPVDHPSMAETCDSCHISFAWSPVTKDFVDVLPPEVIASHPKLSSRRTSSVGLRALFDHTGIVDGCSTCHDGVQATAKPATHISTTSECHFCHTAITWRPPKRVDHTQVVGSCISCHDGVIAVGKSPTHINTTDSCDGCHSIFAFRPLPRVNHAEVIGDCLS